MSGVKNGKGKDEKSTKGKIPSPFSLPPVFLSTPATPCRIPRDLINESETSYTVKPRVNTATEGAVESDRVFVLSRLNLGKMKRLSSPGTKQIVRN